MSRKPMVPVQGNRGMPGAKKPKIEMTPEQMLVHWREVQENESWAKEERPDLEQVAEKHRETKNAAVMKLRTVGAKHEAEVKTRQEGWAEKLREAELTKDKELTDRSGEWDVMLSDAELNEKAAAAGRALEGSKEKLSATQDETRQSEERRQKAARAVEREKEEIAAELEIIAATKRKRADAESRLEKAQEEGKVALKEKMKEEGVTGQTRAGLQKVMEEVNKCTEERTKMQAEVDTMANFVRTFAWVEPDAAAVEAQDNGTGLTTSTIKIAQAAGKAMVFKVNGSVKGDFALGGDLFAWLTAKQRGVLLLSSDKPGALEDILAPLPQRLGRELEIAAIEVSGETHHDLLQADELHHQDALNNVPGLAPMEMDSSFSFPTGTTAALVAETLAAITKRLAARRSPNPVHQCTAAAVTGKGIKLLVLQVPGVQAGAPNQGFFAAVAKLYSESKQARQNLRKTFGGRCLMQYSGSGGQIPVLAAAHVTQATAVDSLRALQRAGMVDMAAGMK